MARYAHHFNSKHIHKFYLWDKENTSQQSNLADLAIMQIGRIRDKSYGQRIQSGYVRVKFCLLKSRENSEKRSQEFTSFVLFDMLNGLGKKKLLKMLQKKAKDYMKINDPDCRLLFIDQKIVPTLDETGYYYYILPYFLNF